MIEIGLIHPWSMGYLQCMAYLAGAFKSFFSIQQRGHGNWYTSKPPTRINQTGSAQFMTLPQCRGIRFSAGRFNWMCGNSESSLPNIGCLSWSAGKTSSPVLWNTHFSSLNCYASVGQTRFLDKPMLCLDYPVGEITEITSEVCAIFCDFSCTVLIALNSMLSFHTNGWSVVNKMVGKHW